MFKRNFIGMLGVNKCFNILVLFVSVFLVARVFFVTGFDITAVALFILLEVVGIFVFYFIASAICAKVKPIWMVRVATVFLCLFILLTVLWADGLYSHFMLFGALWGVVQGLYWGGMNFLITQIFKQNKTLTYFTVNAILGAVIGILFPFTFGFAIDYASWVVAAIAVLAVGIVQVVFSFLVKTERVENQKFQMVAYFRALKDKGHLRPAFTYWAVMVLNGFTYTRAALTSILIIMAFGTNTSIGVFGSVFAVVGIAFLFAYKVSKRNLKEPMFWLAAVLPILVSVGLFFLVSPLTVIIFNAGIAFWGVVDVETGSERMKAVQHYNGEGYFLEGHVFYEWALVVGRSLSCLLLVVVWLLGSPPILFAAAISFTVLTFLARAIVIFIWKRKYTDRL